MNFYRGGGPVATIAPSPARLEHAGDRWLLSGSMRIPDDLAEGNYMVQLLAYDRRESSKKKQWDDQWIDLTLRRSRLGEE